MQLSFETITPEQAQDLLINHNPVNRRLDTSHVQFLAREMERGTFRPDNGDTIRIDDQGNIIDGQHRLAAIMRIGKPVPMLVARNLDPDAFASIDIGKPRSATDIIGIDLHRDGIVAPKGAVASARLLLDYEMGFQSGTDHGKRIDRQPVDAVRAVCRRPGFTDAVTRGARFARDMVVVKTAPSAVAIIACERDNKAAADAYFQRLRTMEGLQRGAPEHSVYRSLRTWRDSGTTVQRSAYGQLFALIRGYIASRDGKRLDLIRIPQTPETFPYLPTNPAE